MYKLTSNPDVVTKDGSFIPKDSNNKDWKKYQKWLGEGNTPLPVDVQPVVVQPVNILIQDLEAAGTIKSIKEALIKFYKGESL